MRTLRSLDVLADRALQARLVRWSAIVFVLTGAIACGGIPQGVWTDGAALGFGWWLLAFVGVSLAALPVHELVHAAFFRLYGGAGTKVTFGFSQFMLYTDAHGLVLPRGQFVWVLLAPAVLVSGAMVVACCALGLPLLALCLAGTHLSGCTGDILMALLALAEPGCTHVRDTERGVDLLGE